MTLNTPELELTPWFPDDVKPVRDGVYERQVLGSVILARYARGTWYTGASVTMFSRAQAFSRAEGSNCPSNYARAPWRGLAQPSTA